MLSDVRALNIPCVGEDLAGRRGNTMKSTRRSPTPDAAIARLIHDAPDDPVDSESESQRLDGIGARVRDPALAPGVTRSDPLR